MRIARAENALLQTSAFNFPLGSAQPCRSGVHHPHSPSCLSPCSHCHQAQHQPVSAAIRPSFRAIVWILVTRRRLIAQCLSWRGSTAWNCSRSEHLSSPCSMRCSSLQLADCLSLDRRQSDQRRNQPDLSIINHHQHRTLCITSTLFWAAMRIPAP